MADNRTAEQIPRDADGRIIWCRHWIEDARRAGRAIKCVEIVDHEGEHINGTAHWPADTPEGAVITPGYRGGRG